MGLLSYITSGIGAISSIASGIAAYKQAKKAQQQLEESQRNERTLAQAEINRNYLDTDAAKSTLNALRKQNERTQRRNNTSAIRAGMTDEARIGMAQGQQEATADAVSRLAGIGTAYQYNARQNYRNLLSKQAQQTYNNSMDRASALASTINGIGSAFNGLSDALNATGGGSDSAGAGATKVQSGSSTSAPVTGSQVNSQNIPAQYKLNGQYASILAKQYRPLYQHYTAQKLLGGGK